jgi:hypothetical protein
MRVAERWFARARHVTKTQLAAVFLDLVQRLRLEVE